MTSVTKYLNTTLDKLNKIGCKYLSRGNCDGAMAATSAAARLLYTSNCVYTDERFEKLLTEISDRLPEPALCQVRERPIVFYDGFGLNSRGLVQIYLKGLCKLSPVVYVTSARQKGTLPDLMCILKEHNGTALWLTDDSYEGNALQLCDIFNRIAPKAAFLYTTPGDAAGLAVFQRYQGAFPRYQINLTDHAYWLGIHSFDTCIEFRDYGASISRDHRGIAGEKLQKLPFYPCVDPSAPFEGFPFPVTPENKVVFSGGALYKTMGGGNLYYRLVEYLLCHHKDALFWYAGSGDSSQLEELMKKYPGRVFYTAERRDLYQVLRRSFLYLSTYPVSGGLMFQHAACAGIIPLTLRHDECADDFLLEQASLEIQFDTFEQVCRQLDRLFTQDDYRKAVEQRVSRAVLDQEAFEKGLRQLLEQGSTGYPIVFKSVDTAALLAEYSQNVKKANLLMQFACKKNGPLLLQMPITMLRSLVLSKRKKMREK